MHDSFCMITLFPKARKGAEGCLRVWQRCMGHRPLQVTSPQPCCSGTDNSSPVTEALDSAASEWNQAVDNSAICGGSFLKACELWAALPSEAWAPVCKASYIVYFCIFLLPIPVPYPCWVIQAISLLRPKTGWRWGGGMGWGREGRGGFAGS